MNILLLTNCIVQPDDTDKSVNDIVFSFAKEWAKDGHRVVIVNSESKFPLLFYKVPKSIVKELKKRGNFTVPSIASRKELRWEKQGVNIIRLPMFKLYPHAAFSEKQYNIQRGKIIDYLNSLQFVPDVVTGHWIEPQLRLVTSLGDYYKAKKALVIHGELPSKISDKYKKMYNSLDTLFFRSWPVAEKMSETYGDRLIEKKKIKVCFSGIPDKFVFEQKPRSDWKKHGVLKLIYVGRLERYKRIDSTLIALSKAFPNKNYIFDIVGDGPERDHLEKIVKEYNLSNQVNFIGRVTRDEVIKKMTDADCFVMISENEVFGLVYLEAMACGCITIASVNGGVDGIIKHNNNGFLCEQGNSEALFAMMQKIDAMEKSEAQTIRDNAYKTICEYTDNQAAKSYLRNITE